MSHEPTTEELTHRLDATLDLARSAVAAPGAQAALVQRGEIVWTGDSGLADVATQAPVTTDTVFCLASLGKTLVAAVALRMLEQEQLDLDAPIGGVIPDVPGSDVVTPRMLLTHTSGYPDIYEQPELAPMFPLEGEVENSGTAYDPNRPFTWEMLRAGFRDPVDPGKRWEYSNGGYIALTELMVRLLGGPDRLAEAWASLAARAAGEQITDDLLTMDRDGLRLDRLAHGYREQEDGTLVDVYAAHSAAGVPTDLFGLPFGDGLFAGTAVGAALFLDGLFVRGTALEPSTVELMTTTTAQAAAAEDAHDPALTTYGMGTFRMETDGRTWQGHRGTYGGFNVIAMSDASHGQTLAVLTNTMGENPQALPVWRALVEALDEQTVTAADVTGSG